jgi:hypothetical protein
VNFHSHPFVITNTTNSRNNTRRANNKLRADLGVGCSDAAEDGVGDRDGGGETGHERADLSHENRESGAANVGRLAAHVGAGENTDLKQKEGKQK